MQHINWMTGQKVIITKDYFSQKHELHVVEYVKVDRATGKERTFVKPKYVFEGCYTELPS